MKVLILMGSPRLHGNTAELCKPFMEELTEQRAEVKYIKLEKKTILPCKECYACQEVAGEYGCAQKDDMPAIAEEMLWEGKKVGIIATHGYDGAYATDPFEMDVERLCKHSNLEYIGMYSVQDEDNLASFQTEEAIAGARAFARKLLK